MKACCAGNPKSQAPNSKQIQNPKLKIPNGPPERRQRFGHLDLVLWDLFGIWSLVLGASCAAGLVLGISDFP
jgi:hypothetical protein